MSQAATKMRLEDLLDIKPTWFSRDLYSSSANRIWRMHTLIKILRLNLSKKIPDCSLRHLLKILAQQSWQWNCDKPLVDGRTAILLNKPPVISQTDIIHGSENLVDTLVQFMYRAQVRIDVCVDNMRPGLAVEIRRLKDTLQKEGT